MNNNTKNFGKPYSLGNASLPEMPSTDSSFEAISTNDRDQQTRTAFNRVRSYDVTVDKINLKIPGAAPIFGSRNKSEVLAWQNDVKANYTGSLNEVYASQSFNAPAVQSREVEIKYYGLCQRDKTYSSKGNLVNFDPNSDKAVNLWSKNVVTLLNELDAAQYRDLKIFDIVYSQKNEDEQLKKWRQAFPQASAMILWQYQQECSAFLTTIISYQYLTAAMPKLAELYPNKAGHFNFLQNKLKTTTYTSPVRSMMVDLKKRFIDKTFFKSFTLPCSVISQEMDGINSPLAYVIQTQTILKQKYSFKGEDTGYAICNYAITQDDKGTSESRTLNAFTLDTILNIILASSSDTDIQASLVAWLDTAKVSLMQAAAALLDFVRNPIVMAVETALAKLKVAPESQFNWTQNLDFGEIRNVDRFQYWEMVDTLINFNSTAPKFHNNGYTISVPMFRRTGMSKQFMLEYFQVFYLNAYDYISFVDIKSTVSIRLRDNSKITLSRLINGDQSAFSLTTTDALLDPEKLMTAFSDRFTAVYCSVEIVAGKVKCKTFDSESQSTLVIKNPDLMTWVTYSVVDRSADVEVWLAQNFVITLA